MTRPLFLIVLWLAAAFPLKAQDYNIALLGHLPMGTRVSSLWGYTDETGREYALVGLVNGGIAIVDVTNPGSPLEIMRTEGTTSNWREIKVYKDFAYVITEAPLGAIQIIDLRPLPDSGELPVSLFTENGLLSTSHTLWIDEEGLLYLWGTTRVPQKKGYAVYDLKNNPMEPEFLFTVSTPYVHDGLVRGNRMYLSLINEGVFAIYDVSDKQHPVLLGQQMTPNNFTHNTWPTDNGKYLLATDERKNSYLSMFYIEDPANISETDRIQTAPGSQAIVHNTHVLGDFAVTSYYAEGVTIHDISDPENIVEVGKYDTSPFEGPVFAGVWEVYPYFPSGNIIAGDIEQGLFVMRPAYRKAGYLYGRVSDAVTGKLLVGAEIRFEGVDITDRSKLEGIYKTGIGSAGTYSVTFSREGYYPKTINGVQMENGSSVELNVALTPLSTGVKDLETDETVIYPVPFQDIIFFSGTRTCVLAEIFDYSGRKLVTESSPAGLGRLSGLGQITPGYYRLQVTFSDGTVAQRGVIKN